MKAIQSAFYTVRFHARDLVAAVRHVVWRKHTWVPYYVVHDDGVMSMTGFCCRICQEVL